MPPLVLRRSTRAALQKYVDGRCSLDEMRDALLWLADAAFDDADSIALATYGRTLSLLAAYDEGRLTEPELLQEFRALLPVRVVD